MNNYRTIQQKDMHKLFPAWENNIPTLGIKNSQPGNKTGLRFAISLLLMFVLGINTAWGQTEITALSQITDANGNFSIVIKRPDRNFLQVTYIGYKPYKTAQPIGSRSNFRIEMIDNNAFKEAVVKSTRKVQSNGLVIPEKELSIATQTFDMDAMEGLSFETAGEALQGQIAGLDIVSNSGNLGAGTSMRLRGVTSINGNQEPLIVVDGYILPSYDKSELNLENMDDDQMFANLLQINPEDIKSIKVLKDASATAIYGSDGSNGVIEITTRRGTRGKTRVNFTYRFTGTWQPEGMKMLNGDGYTMMLKEAYFNPQQSDVASGIVELMYLRDTHPAYYENYNKNTDWVKEVTQFGQVHNFGVSINGGGEKAQLTYTILGSAIAYQFGLTKDGLQAKSLRFIAIDEAFKAQDEDKARYLISLCKQLNLQLLVVTPSDNIHIVENDISFVHYVERSGNESRLFDMPIEIFKQEREKYQANDYAN